MSKELREQFTKEKGMPFGDLSAWAYALWLESKLKEAEEQNKPKTFTIDFNGHVKCLVRINNNMPYIQSAMNGHGDSIDILDIKVYLNQKP